MALRMFAQTPADSCVRKLAADAFIGVQDRHTCRDGSAARSDACRSAAATSRNTWSPTATYLPIFFALATGKRPAHGLRSCA
jgi:hypothetical protein